MRMPRRFVSLITGMTIAIAAAWAGSPALAASVDPDLRPYSTKPAPRVYVEQQTLPDGSTVPVLRPRSEQEAPESLVFVEPLTVTVKGSNGSNIIPYTGQTEEPITVTVTDPSQADAPVPGVYVDLGWVSGTTGDNGQVTLNLPVYGSMAHKVQVGDQFAWFAILDVAQDALLQVSMTDQSGTPISSGDVDFYVVQSDHGTQTNRWGFGPAYVWAVLPAGVPTRVVGVTTTGEELYELYQDLTPQSYQTGGLREVILDGTSAVALPVTVSLDDARVEADVLLAPQDSFSYTISRPTLYTNESSAGTLFVTPGTYEVGYHVNSSTEARTFVYDTVTFSTATTALNAEFSSSGLATLQTAFVDLPDAIGFGIFLLDHGKLSFSVEEGTIHMKPGDYQLTNTLFDIDTWVYGYLVHPDRRTLTLTAGETYPLPFPAKPRAWSFESFETPEGSLRGWVNLRNSAGDTLVLAEPWDGPVPVGEVRVYSEDDQMVDLADLDLFGFDWLAPAIPADHLYTYEGAYDLGPLGSAIDVAGILTVGTPTHAVTDPTVIPAYVPTDLMIEVVGGAPGATVQIGEAGPTQTLDENGQALFEGLKVPGPQPIYVDGLRKGMVQAYGAADVAQVIVEAPVSTKPLTEFQVLVKLLQGEDVYGVQVNLNLDPTAVQVVGVTETDPMAPNASWTAGPTISDDGGQLQYLVSRLGEVAGTGGEVPLLLMNLQLVGDVTAVDLATAVEVKLVDSMGNPIPAAVHAGQVAVGTQINGTVTSAGLPVRSASVTVVDSATGKEVAVTSTGGHGDFFFVVPDDGTYEVLASAWPYVTEVATVIVTNGEPDMATLSLTLLFGDANSDDLVTAADLPLLMDRYADPTLSGTPADLNNDGRFDLHDLYYAAQNVGSTTLLTQKEEGQ